MAGSTFTVGMGSEALYTDVLADALWQKCTAGRTEGAVDLGPESGLSRGA